MSVNEVKPCTSDSASLTTRQLRLLTEESDVVLIITRSKNENTVVYKVIRDGSRICDSNPVDVSWQKLESIAEENMERLRAMRSGLLWIERRLAYGMNVRKTATSGQFAVELVSLPGREFILYCDDHGVCRLKGSVSGRECFLFRVFVNSTENFFGLPTVHFVNIHGVEISSSQEIVEKVIP